MKPQQRPQQRASMHTASGEIVVDTRCIALRWTLDVLAHDVVCGLLKFFSRCWRANEVPSSLAFTSSVRYISFRTGIT